LEHIGEALGRFNKSLEHNEPEGDEEEKEEEGDGKGHAAVFHVDHGKTHSSHKIGHDGTAESESHEAGEMKETCPLCGSEL